MDRIRTTSEFGSYLRSSRKRQGYTQTELAEAAGVSVSYIVHLEQGKPTSEIGKALHLCEMLSISIFAEERA